MKPVEDHEMSAVLNVAWSIVAQCERLHSPYLFISLSTLDNPFQTNTQVV
jgi:hypothetical protein